MSAKERKNIVASALAKLRNTSKSSVISTPISAKRWMSCI